MAALALVVLALPASWGATPALVACCPEVSVAQPHVLLLVGERVDAEEVARRVQVLVDVLGLSAYEARQRVLRQGLRRLRTAQDPEALSGLADRLRAEGLNALVLDTAVLEAPPVGRRASSVALSEGGLTLLRDGGSPLVVIGPETSALLVVGDLEGDPTDLKLNRPMELQARLVHIGVNRNPALRLLTDDAHVLVLGRAFDFAGLGEGVAQAANLNFALLVRSILERTSGATLDATWLLSDVLPVRLPSASELEDEATKGFEAHARGVAAVWRAGALGAPPASRAEAPTVDDPAPGAPSAAASPPPAAPVTAADDSAEPVWVVCGRCELRYRFRGGGTCPRCAQGFDPTLDSLGGSLVPWIAGGLAALAGSAVWVGVLLATGYELGYVAWGVGGLIGLVVAVAKPPGARGALAAGVCAVGFLLVAKVASAALIVVPVAELFSFHDLIWFGLAIATAAGVADRGSGG